MRKNIFCCFISNISALVLMVCWVVTANAHHVNGVTAQAEQDNPIKLGTSGSSREHIVIKNRLFCYTGTLGALVTDGSDQYILSNNHVLAKENGNLNLGTGGDEIIIQPGLLDLGTCTLSSGDNATQVATLSDFVVIEFGKGKTKPVNYVDAAIAIVSDNKVDSDGSILGIGPLTGRIASAAVDQPVQKTGRTTGHTFGTVLATGVTIDVKYDSGTARFADQIRIRHVCEGDDFSASGDSGSHIVTVPESGDPESVGLLFAGGDVDTFANPIAAVLDSTGGLSVSMDAGTTDGDTIGAMASDYETVSMDCDTSDGGGGGGRPGGGRPFNSADPVGLSIASEVQARNSDAIFALPDVVGHGIGVNEAGEAVIEIYVASKERRAVGKPLPSDIEGVAIRMIETGVIRAF